jgi:hypothetical protein
MNNISDRKKKRAILEETLPSVDESKTSSLKTPAFLVMSGVIVIIVIASVYFGAGASVSSKGPARAPLAKQVQNPLFSTSIIDQRKPVDQMAEQLYLIHPDEQCRRDMTEWLTTYKVMIDVVDEQANPAATLDSSIEYQTGLKRNVPVITFTKDFFSTTRVEDDNDIVLYKYAAMYHEYVHIRNHINGKWLLPAPTNLISEKPLDVQAKYFWGTEYDAYHSEWEFLKKYHGSHLMIPDSVVAQIGENQAFAAYLLDRIQKGHQQRPGLSQKDFETMNKVWIRLAKNGV